MHARGGRTLARAGAWRGMFHVKHSSGDARTHAGRRPGRGQHADCRRRSLVRGGAVRTRAACTSSVAPRARGGGRLGAAALAQRGELGGACEGRRLRRGCARGAGACVGDARAPAGAAGQALGAAGPCAGGRSRRSGRVRLRAKRSASRRPPVPRRLPPRIDSRTARPPPRRPLAPLARLRADPPCVFSAPLLPKTRLRALFGRQFRILDHSSRSQRAFSPKASVSFRRAVIAVRGLDFGRSGRAVSHEAFVEALRGRPAPSAPCARCLSPRRRYNRHP